MSLLFGIIVGFSLGLTGGGGSIFAVPLLVYGLALPVHQAVVISLAAMIIVSAIAGETWIALRKLRSIQATPVMAQPFKGDQFLFNIFSDLKFLVRGFPGT